MTFDQITLPNGLRIVGEDGAIHLNSLIELSLGLAIGAITFTGSVIAFAKLNGNMGGAPILLPARHLLNLLIAAAIVALIVVLVASGGSARKFSGSIDWLRESALSIQCYNTTETHVPLNVDRIGDMFKMYLADVGILTAMMGFRAKKDILDNTLVGFAKGGLYENAIAEQLVSKGYTPYYHQKSPRQGEIDFVIEHESGIVPIEVKAGRNTSSSFDAMLRRDDVAFGYKFITGNVGRVGKKITLPHYMSMFV